MPQKIANQVPDQPRVLMVSMRNLKLHVSRSAPYEFEDVICGCDTVDLISPNFNDHLFKITNKIANQAAKIIKNGEFIKSLINYHCEVNKEYDVFFFFCQSIQDILVLNSIKGWRDKCRYAICWLDELWAKDIDSWKVQLRLLKNFDHIFMNFTSSVHQVADIVQCPCYSIAYGVNTINFCPHPRDLYRCIDILSVGRRSVVTHQALLKHTEQENFFYIYDTIKDLYMLDYRYHRSLYTNFVKRSRYMIVNKAKFDLSGQSNSQEEVGPRFFEGAAGGTIMLGVSPKCEAFNDNFDWSDAVIDIPFDCPDISNMISDLDAQPERLAKIRQDNIINSLLRHDWVYRWEKILATVGLDITPQMLERKAYLRKLTEMVNVPESCDHQPQVSLVN
ncbi:hypothetical protein BZZ01_31420 [Nostocales cyanobacterium HT-58-2]|nr:hypothetical protein BZZ01_31420 [Nostocales cyanobacterium HT-58-2]